MTTGLERLSELAYPGRVIVAGTLAGGSSVVAYAVTGRSPSSQARRFVVGDDGNVYTRPTDEAVLATGNPALLVYPAVMFYGASIAVSNGAQTRLVYEELIRNTDRFAAPAELLVRSFRTPQFVADIDITRFEPDEPNYTPRISGCLTPAGASLSIAKRAAHGEPVRGYFDVPLAMAGQGRFIATYAGGNASPLQSFEGEPREIGLTADTCEALASDLYEALGPAAGQPDYRVAVVVAEMSGGSSRSLRIINRADL